MRPDESPAKVFVNTKKLGERRGGGVRMGKWRGWVGVKVAWMEEKQRKNSRLGVEIHKIYRESLDKWNMFCICLHTHVVKVVFVLYFYMSDYVLFDFFYEYVIKTHMRNINTHSCCTSVKGGRFISSKWKSCIQSKRLIMQNSFCGCYIIILLHHYYWCINMKAALQCCSRSRWSSFKLLHIPWFNP